MEYLVKRNKQKKKYEKYEVREKLETVLVEAAIEKQTSGDYDLDDMLEQKGMTVNGDNVIVDNYNFLIDREKLKIVEELGETAVKITKEVKKYIGKNENGKYEVEVLLKVEGNTGLRSVEIEKPDGTKTEMSTEELTIGKDITLELDEEYKITVTTEDGKTDTRKVEERSKETISSAKELAELRDKVNNGLTYEGKTINLTKNLDLRSVCSEEKPWTSIGGFNESIEGMYNVFSGTFNGSKHTIDYLYIDTDSELSQGLFGYILNSTITGVVIGEHSSINAIRNVGGIVGCAINSTISYCGNNGTVTGSQDCIGGIVGTLNCGEIIACYNKGDITSCESEESCNVGGICGNANADRGNDKRNLIQYSYNTGIITSISTVGGIVGYPTGYVEIEKCYNKGNIKGDEHAGDDANGYGGIVGTLMARDKEKIQSSAKSQVNYTCNIGSLNSNGIRIGGICGHNRQYCIVKNSYILQGLEIKKGEAQATREIGASNLYLGKYVGQAYSTSISYISGNGEITNEVNTENGDITDTVYYIVNGLNKGESQY